MVDKSLHQRLHADVWFAFCSTLLESLWVENKEIGKDWFFYAGVNFIVGSIQKDYKKFGHRDQNADFARIDCQSQSSGILYTRSVARSFSSTCSAEASDSSVAWKVIHYCYLKLNWIFKSVGTCMYFWTPTRHFLRASKLEEYSIFFLMRAVSGHQDIKSNFSFMVFSEVPWHWCWYSKSNKP